MSLFELRAELVQRTARTYLLNTADGVIKRTGVSAE